jgi:hypothetical protein
VCPVSEFLARGYLTKAAAIEVTYCLTYPSPNETVHSQTEQPMSACKKEDLMELYNKPAAQLTQAQRTSLLCQASVITQEEMAQVFCINCECQCYSSAAKALK